MVFIFLQNWRATLIPLLTVPVSLVGAFIFFPMLGFSINVLSLLGLVLAIGIVVDDAIVVVEAVMHHIEHGMAPKDAALKAMEEVSGPVVAIALILAAVFVPVGFMGGISGRLYQQFAITIAISVLLSAFNALTLSPALAALLLKPATGKKTLLTPFYRIFNRAFGAGTNGYITAGRLPVAEADRGRRARRRDHVPGGPVHGPHPAGLHAGGGPGVHPGQRDAARCLLPRAERRRHAEGRGDPGRERGGRRLQHDHRLQPAHRRVLIEHGVLLRPAQAVGGAAHRRTALERHRGRAQPGVPRQIPEAVVVAFGPPAIPGLGTGAGFTMELQDRIGNTPQYLGAQTQRFIEAARKRPEIGRISTLYRPSVPQVYADIDRSKVLKVGVPISDVNTTLGALLGSAYMNDFNRFGRVYKVYVQAEPEYRRDPKQFGLFFVRGASGNMVPLDTLITTRETSGPEFTNRFNLYRAAEVTGVPAEGYSSAQALKALEEVAAATLPPEMGYDWADLSFQEKRAPISRAHVRRRNPARLPRARRAVRELDPAVQRPARHAVRGVRRVLRALGRAPFLDELRQQHLRPDRPHHADWPGGEERDPDRRVREDAARAGEGRSHRRARVREAAVPAHSDDRVRVHPGRHAARQRRRRGRRGAQGDGHGGVLRAC